MIIDEIRLEEDSKLMQKEVSNPNKNIRQAGRAHYKDLLLGMRSGTRRRLESASLSELSKAICPQMQIWARALVFISEGGTKSWRGSAAGMDTQRKSLLGGCDDWEFSADSLKSSKTQYRGIDRVNIAFLVPLSDILPNCFVQTTILLNKHRTQHRRRRTNLASVLKEVSVALVDTDVTYAPQADNVPLPMDRLKGRHFLSICPITEASDSRDKKAQFQCKVCADRAKTAGQTPAERERKDS
ncbi:hypothetical protein PoB_000466400 [Plakobranchus ocellatus]|uniref:Uncharacterized protein n=1 Tax=Plakobranchus ocellatus TaxID=259542 RepID=A0AAV3Y7T8_9GAST|nr:hypothetical protein PoB_000466400 [Plakobranchus ocellatus]